jgi:hypothetical protein
MQIRLKPETYAALQEYNLRTDGRGLKQTFEIDDEVLERLTLLAMPGEDIDSTIIRLLNNPGTARQQ